MFLKLRVFFTILSALCLAAIIPAAVWGGWLWLGILGGGALFFFAMMLLCKQSQEKQEAAQREKENPTVDFLSPKE